MSQSWSLILITGIAVLSSAAVTASARLRRCRAVVPAAVVEIALGIVVGPGVLGWVWDGEALDVLAHAGLAALIFLAGFGINVAVVGGTALRRAVWPWIAALALGLGAGVLLRGGRFGEGALVGVALTTTSLGAALPMADRRLREAAVAGAAVGVTGPVVATAALMALLVGRWVPGAIAVMTVGVVVWAMRPRGAEPAVRAVSGATVVRWGMLLLAAMVWASQVLGLDVLLGAFAVGVAARRLFGGSGTVARTAEAVGAGFLVPFCYVVTGIDLDLGALGGSGWSLALVPLLVLLLLVVRGGPIALFAPREVPGRARVALALNGATALPLVVVITTLGLNDDRMPPGSAAALVVAGMVSAVLFPAIPVPASVAPTSDPAAPVRSPYGSG